MTGKHCHVSDIERMDSKIEKVLWSVAIPGLGQLLNGKFLKGLLFVALEFWININAHLNEIIVLSFQGDIMDSVEAANFQWLMFYPCIYMFAMWDAFRDAGGGHGAPLSYLPFIFPAFFGTIGVIYSPKLTVAGFLIGPIWLPMILAFVGMGIGLVVKRMLSHRLVNNRKNVEHGFF